MKQACAIVLVLLLTLSAVGCTGQNQQQDSVYKTNLMLDTIVQITLYDWEDSSTIDLAFDEIRRLESLLSVEQEGSDLYRLAQAAGKEWVEISSETEEVLRLSKEYYTLSQGHFDVTIGPLVDLWNIHNGEGHYPTQEELDATLPLINSDDLLVEEGRAYLARGRDDRQSRCPSPRDTLPTGSRICWRSKAWNMPSSIWGATFSSSEAVQMAATSRLACRIPTRKKAFWPIPWPPRTKAW